MHCSFPLYSAEKCNISLRTTGNRRNCNCHDTLLPLSYLDYQRGDKRSSLREGIVWGSHSCHHVMAAETLFLNSCHHVVAKFWARVLCSLAAEDACFRMRITLGVVLIRSLVFHICFPECSRNGSGVRP